MKVFYGLALLLLVLALLVLDESGYHSEEIRFEAAGQSLCGSLLLPQSRSKPVPVTVFVHGDGAMDRDSSGYYQPYFDALLAQGVAVFSWDKPGVGASEGDWLQQSMNDRSQEVLEALGYLRSRDDVDVNQIGLIGFSQAGWVMPRVLTQDSGVAYAVFISTAINWRQQGQFLTQQRLLSLDLTEQQIQAALAYNQAMDERLASGISYQAYLNYRQQYQPESFQGPAMSKPRFEFVVNNIHADIEHELSAISQPVLAVFADSDQQVDIEHSLSVYFEQIESRFSHHIYPDADHGLFKQRYFKGQGKDGLWFWFKMIVLGKEGLAEGVTTDIARWVTQQIDGGQGPEPNSSLLVNE